MNFEEHIIFLIFTNKIYVQAYKKKIFNLGKEVENFLSPARS